MMGLREQWLIVLGLVSLHRIHGELFVKGCRELNYCWGHGQCVSRGVGAPATSCSCFDGWGSPRDLEYALSPKMDCSERVCAHGPGELLAERSYPQGAKLQTLKPLSHRTLFLRHILLRAVLQRGGT